MKFTRVRSFIAGACVAAACAGCVARDGDASRSSERVDVVATATVLASLVEAVGGNRVAVTSLVPAGASVETYEPSPQDIARVADARLVVRNGAGLDAWLDHLVDNAHNADLVTVVASAGLPLIAKNPHLWTDPRNAAIYVEKIATALERVDASHAAEYARNSATYRERLAELDRDNARAIATIPPPRRAMVVYHDAWRYYARRYGLRTIGSIESAPGREPVAGAMASLIDAARAAGVDVVFSEPEESARLASAVAESLPGGRVVPLYVDSVSTDGNARDYLSMMRYDTRAIVAALR